MSIRSVLQFMHQADWVHRDISVGNVYWYEPGLQGLLADFEYAKKMNKLGEHEVITVSIATFVAKLSLYTHCVYCEGHDLLYGG